MSTDEFVGFFIDDKTFCRRCIADGNPEAVTVYPTDIALGYVAQACDSCGELLCTAEQWTQAQRWVEQYG